MSRAPEQLAPSWLPRQQRRHVDRALRRLMRRDVCSVCGGKLQHSCTVSGLDTQGNVVLAGECCSGRVATVFGMGFYSDRKYDFLRARKTNTEPSTNTEPTNAQIADAIATYQEIVAETDKVLDDIERRGGVRPSGVNLLNSPWKTDAAAWFCSNQKRSHRMRAPFPGELVRQVEPGSRIRAAVRCSVLPLSDDEAAAHALFEVAMGREGVPPDVTALIALIEKYTVRKEPGQ